MPTCAVPTREALGQLSPAEAAPDGTSRAAMTASGQWEIPATFALNPVGALTETLEKDAVPGSRSTCVTNVVNDPATPLPEPAWNFGSLSFSQFRSIVKFDVPVTGVVPDQGVSAQSPRYSPHSI